MSTRPMPAPSNPPAHPAEDFEWPPATDELTVYELGPVEPWRRQEASSDACAPQHDATPPVQERPAIARAVLLIVGALIIGFAARTLYHATTSTHPVEAGDRAPAAPIARPPGVTIVTTYPAARGPATPAQDAIAPGDAPPAEAPDEPTETLTALERTPGPDSVVTPATDTQAAANISTLTASLAAPMPVPVPADTRALARAFASLDRHDVRFDRCDIDASGEHGSAVCVGTVRYVPSAGRGVEREGHITWTFDLARSGQEWRIERLSAR